jgi:hypothetical protein
MSNASRIPRFAARVGAVTALALGLLAAAAVEAAPPTRTYRITIQNLMPTTSLGGSQTLSPALVVVHDRSFDLWSVGEPAHQAVMDVAEDALTATGTSIFRTVGGVETVIEAGTPIAPGSQVSFEITSDGDARYLSLVTMLVNTNDAFTGLDAIHLTGGTKTYRVYAYDAGTEVNDQLRASIPGPCCNDLTRAGTTENNPITRHTGILASTGDLTPEIWGWNVNQPVALITVERLRD